MTHKLDCGCKPKREGPHLEMLRPEWMCEAHRLEWLTLHHSALKMHKERMAALIDTAWMEEA